MWKLDQKEDWVLKNWCFWTVVLEKTLESPLDSKEIKPVHHKGNQPWKFIGRANAGAEPPVLWLPDARADSLAKTLIMGKIEGRRRMGQQRIRWLHGITDWMSGHEFEQTLEDDEGQGSLACYNSWSCKELDTCLWTWLNLKLPSLAPLDLQHADWSWTPYYQIQT